MSLRVLLADESSTIKKVIQLSLQDFNVEVKAVTVGLDVLAVAKTFQPDIVFADVLLAKRSGYEVCHDLKSDPATNGIPVVLMWSGFMEIDEQKARLCGADRRLEKPFDAAGIRQIVQDTVQKTLTNPVSSFVKFPPLPQFEDGKSAEAPPTAAVNFVPPTPTNPQPTAPQPAAFQPVAESTKTGHTIPKIQDDGDSLVIDDSDSDEEWVQQPPPKVATPSNKTFPIPTQQQKEDEFTEFSLSPQPTTTRTQPIAPDQVIQQAKTQPIPAPASANVNNEAIVRQEIQKWMAQNMPAIAERLIREEINRLLQETDQSIQGL